MAYFFKSSRELDKIHPFVNEDNKYTWVTLLLKDATEEHATAIAKILTTQGISADVQRTMDPGGPEYCRKNGLIYEEFHVQVEAKDFRSAITMLDIFGKISKQDRDAIEARIEKIESRLAEQNLFAPSTSVSFRS